MKPTRHGWDKPVIILRHDAKGGAKYLYPVNPIVARTLVDDITEVAMKDKTEARVGALGFDTISQADTWWNNLPRRKKGDTKRHGLGVVNVL